MAVVNRFRYGLTKSSLFALVIQIWVLLEDPAHLVGTSRRFRSFSQDAYFRARWFLTRFPRYEVIFRAIARPRVFNVALFEMLLSGGAPLSRHLVQLLHLLHNPWTLTGQRDVRWGADVSLEAYAAVIDRAISLYGASNIKFDPNIRTALMTLPSKFSCRVLNLIPALMSQQA